MSWLDDMEVADSAYPDPGDGPWAAPGYVPDTSRGLPPEVGHAIGDWAREQNARTAERGLYRVHAELDDGHLAAARDLIDDWRDRHTRTSGAEHHGRDWHLVHDAEAAARDKGLRTTVPQPHGQHTPAWQADAQAWGTGRGIGPDGPEAG